MVLTCHGPYVLTALTIAPLARMCSHSPVWLPASIWQPGSSSVVPTQATCLYILPYGLGWDSAARWKHCSSSTIAHAPYHMQRHLKSVYNFMLFSLLDPSQQTRCGMAGGCPGCLASQGTVRKGVWHWTSTSASWHTTPGCCLQRVRGSVLFKFVVLDH